VRQHTRTHCPECDTEAFVMVCERVEITDSVVKDTSEEVVLEIKCKEPDCSNVWRAVYSFTGNQ
jgi:hypothetical protein